MACWGRPRAASPTRRWRTRSPAAGATSCCGRSNGSRIAASACSMATRTACSFRQGSRTRRARRRRALSSLELLNTELATYVQQRWRVQSRLSLKFEKLYLRLFLSRARHSTRARASATPGYVWARAARRASSSSSAWRSCEATGRRWRSRFSGSSISGCSTISLWMYLREVVKEVRSGALDDALVYRKNLRKREQEYTATTPRTWPLPGSLAEAGALDQLCDDDGGAGADRQHPGASRPGALRSKAGQAGG